QTPSRNWKRECLSRLLLLCIRLHQGRGPQSNGLVPTPWMGFLYHRLLRGGPTVDPPRGGRTLTILHHCIVAHCSKASRCRDVGLATGRASWTTLMPVVTSRQPRRSHHATYIVGARPMPDPQKMKIPRR